MFGKDMEAANLAFYAGLVGVVVAVAFTVDVVSAEWGVINVAETVLLQSVEEVVVVGWPVQEFGRGSWEVTGCDLAVKVTLEIGECGLKAWIFGDELIVG